ncbi:MAG: hypothetical protein AAFX93_12570 [Verrucomicrobiota bacterium]
MKFSRLSHIAFSLMLSGFLMVALPSVAQAKKPASTGQDKTNPGQEKKNDKNDTTDTTDTTTGTTTDTTDSTGTTDTTDTTDATDATDTNESSGFGIDLGLDDSDDGSGDTISASQLYSVTEGNGANAVTTIYAPGTEESPSVIHFSSDFSLGNNVVIDGHAIIIADQGFDFKNQEVQITDDSTLVMYVKGDVGLQGNGDVNTLAPPASFIIYGTGGNGQSIGLGGNAGLSAVIYAPDASFSIKGTSGMLGAVIANTISNNGQGSTNHEFNGLNYDEALKDLALGTESMIMEDYRIMKAKDDFQGDPQNGSYEDFFATF